MSERLPKISLEKALMMSFQCVAEKILFEARLLEEIIEENPEFPEWIKEYAKKINELNREYLNK